MSTKKYELTDEVIYIGLNRTPLHRIRAIRDFGSIKSGDIGGYIESENNLSHDGNCWIGNNSKVFHGAHILDNVTVFGNCVINGDVIIKDNVQINGNVLIACDEHDCGYKHAIISDYVEICDRASIFGRPTIKDFAKICDDCFINGTPIIHGDAIVRNNATVSGNVTLNTFLKHGECIGGNALISNRNQILYISMGDTDYTFFKGGDDILVGTRTLPKAYELKCFKDIVESEDSTMYKPNDIIINGIIGIVNEYFKTK